MTPLTLLVTRPSEDALPLVARLEALNHRVVCEPLLKITQRNAVLPPLDGFSGLIFTSANGVRAFCHVSDQRDLPSYAVGDRTAVELRAQGFDSIVTAGGDSLALADIIRRSRHAEDGALLHIAGTEVAGDLAGELGASGFVVTRHALYSAVAATRFSPFVLAALKAGTIDGVLLFSPRTARIFVDLVRADDLLQPVRRVLGLCLSKAVAEALQPLELSQLLIAHLPTQEALLAKLDDTSLQSRNHNAGEDITE